MESETEHFRTVYDSIHMTPAILASEVLISADIDAKYNQAPSGKWIMRVPADRFQDAVSILNEGDFYKSNPFYKQNPYLIMSIVDVSGNEITRTAKRHGAKDPDLSTIEKILSKEGYELGPVVGKIDILQYPLVAHVYVSPEKSGEGRIGSMYHTYPVKKTTPAENPSPWKWIARKVVRGDKGKLSRKEINFYRRHKAEYDRWLKSQRIRPRVGINGSPVYDKPGRTRHYDNPMNTKVIPDDLREAFSAIILWDTQKATPASSAARSYVRPIVEGRISLTDANAMHTQILYIQSNLQYWKGPQAQTVKRVLRKYANEFKKRAKKQSSSNPLTQDEKDQLWDRHKRFGKLSQDYRIFGRMRESEFYRGRSRESKDIRRMYSNPVHEEDTYGEELFRQLIEHFNEWVRVADDDPQRGKDIEYLIRCNLRFIDVNELIPPPELKKRFTTVQRFFRNPSAHVGSQSVQGEDILIKPMSDEQRLRIKGHDRPWYDMESKVLKTGWAQITDDPAQMGLKTYRGNPIPFQFVTVHRRKPQPGLAYHTLFRYDPNEQVAYIRFVEIRASGYVGQEVGVVVDPYRAGYLQRWLTRHGYRGLKRIARFGKIAFKRDILEQKETLPPYALEFPLSAFDDLWTADPSEGARHVRMAIVKVRQGITRHNFEAAMGGLTELITLYRYVKQAGAMEAADKIRQTLYIVRNRINVRWPNAVKELKL